MHASDGLSLRHRPTRVGAPAARPALALSPAPRPALAYATKHRDWLLRLPRLIRDGEPQRVAEWWERELSAKVPPPDVEVPPLSGGLPRGATHILDEGPAAP